MIHARLTVSWGMNTAIQKPNSSHREPGISVRASIHASETEITIPITSRATDNVIELASAPARLGSTSAARQFAMPQVLSRPNGPSWKLCTTINATGQTTSTTILASMITPARPDGANLKRGYHGTGATDLLRFTST